MWGRANSHHSTEKAKKDVRRDSAGVVFWTDIEEATTTLCIHFPGVVLGKQVPKDRRMCGDHWGPVLLHLILTTALRRGQQRPSRAPRFTGEETDRKLHPGPCHVLVIVGRSGLESNLIPKSLFQTTRLPCGTSQSLQCPNMYWESRGCKCNVSQTCLTTES